MYNEYVCLWSENLKIYEWIKMYIYEILKWWRYWPMLVSSTRSLIMVARGYRTKSRNTKGQSRLFLFFFFQMRCFGDTRPRLIKFVINKWSLGLNILTTSNRRKKRLNGSIQERSIMCVVCDNAHIRMTGRPLLGSKLPLLRKNIL